MFSSSCSVGLMYCSKFNSDSGICCVLVLNSSRGSVVSGLVSVSSNCVFGDVVRKVF